MRRTVAVVGASLAGLSAARALRAQCYDGRIVVIGDEAHAPYDRPPLSKEFLAGRASLADIALGTPDDTDLDVEWRLGTTAVGLDHLDRSVRLADGSEVRADGVVLATGARARRLSGSEGLRGVHVLRSLDDAVALREDLATAAHLVVIGAGFIGAEVASTARTLGLEVTVVETQPVPLAGPLGADMGAVCAQLHADHGTRLLVGSGVAGLVGTGRVEAVELTDGTRLPADVVVVGIGATPNVEWLADSGVALGNGVLTDARCATSIPGVVAVGDCAAAWSTSRERHVRVEHWTHALEQPATAVATLLGTDRPAPTPVPYFWSDQYGARIQFAGSRREDDEVRVLEGSRADRSFLAVYERHGDPVAVLGVDQPRLFTRWRRQLRTAVLTHS
ncbi:FAD-dependent oxidoreductase [Modestobacter marinus]|uniref:NADPH-dependent 2,4-dienoyl-CoA reductase/sulfur reductase-like enzyme n=1 Tax=Modestobacter marinus TaxID=477641 RepID=A0A846LND4_9ACTN|nr:FAD-dependent oxidoreductase [Modestobacter marinus]NIH68957.1 NADPH-dependent 2,4-dienoyl-CoA reductase/sulfur reductase-like enzyme [Modestobacter marinus]GGL78641.1 pyridine nucleotide-disulfide oxidoreductase [Modestobacter marinus]